MNKEEIKNKLMNTYDEFSSDIISNSIFEFQEVFKEKYFKTEEVIDLVTKNIPYGIKIFDDLDRFDATCSIDNKIFKISKVSLEDKDYFNYVFFHEFIHSITFNKYNGVFYMGFYSADVNEDYQFKSRAFNEVVTEYLALKRNDYYKYNHEDKALSGYDLGTVELKLLFNIIDEEELINSYFHSPFKLESILNKYNMNIDEMFYAFHALEDRDYDFVTFKNNRGMDNPNDIFKLIDGERYIFYNMLDSIGLIKNEDDFNKKWTILLREFDLKYNFYDIDGILRFGELCKDIERLNISQDNMIANKIPKEKLDKYKLLSSIFDKGEPGLILKELYNIYIKDYHEYFELMKNDVASLAYVFLNKINNNYQLYDIEMYPRVYPYLEKEKQTIDKVVFRKILCEEANIKFYIFNINEKYYVESNYDDLTVRCKNESIYEVEFDNQIDTLDISNNTYKIGNNIYNCKEIY